MTVEKALPPSARNNNPGNIRLGDPWQGLMPLQEMNAEQQAEKDFCVFQSPKWGFRAMARVLISYQDKYGIDTITGVISRWAPATENNTLAYITDVCVRVGVNATDTQDFHTYAALAPLVKAIAIHETGKWLFDDHDLEAGIRLAGVEPPVAALAQSRTIQTGVTGIALPAVTGGLLEAIQQLEPAIKIVAQVKEYWAPVAITILVVAVGTMVYFRIDDWYRAKR